MGVMARMLCPITCGYASPKSKLFLTTGCPPKCTSLGSFLPYDESIAALPCTEMNHTDLHRSSVWLSWIQQLENYGAAVGDPDHIVFKIAHGMMQEGCATFATNLTACSWRDLALPFKSPSSMCPRTCKCDSPSAQSITQHCPEMSKCWKGCRVIANQSCGHQVGHMAMVCDGQECVFPFIFEGNRI